MDSSCSRIQRDISVVIPTHDRLDFLQKAVRSCFEDNEDVGVEVVVVDDGSMDGTWAWLSGVSDNRVRAFRQANQGPQVARNRGLEEARGRFVKFLDDDDWLAEGTLQREVKALRKSGAEMAAGVFHHCRNGELIHTQRPPSEPDPYLDLAQKKVEVCIPLRFTLDRDLAGTVGWDPQVSVLQDIDFMLRAAFRASSYTAVEETSGFHRMHERIRQREVGGASGPASVNIYCRLASLCLEDGASSKRRKATQIGLWKSIHNCYLYDSDLAVEAWEWIERLGDSFFPPREYPVLSTLDRLLGPMKTERMMAPVRKVRAALLS